MNRLLVTADDFGLHDSVNRGILRLAEEGLVDRVSVMAHPDAALGDLKALAGTGVEVGIHLVFVDERPVRKDLLSPILGPEGTFPRTYAGLFGLMLRKPRLGQMLAQEATAQMDRLMAAGVRISHVNSHQHVHLFPPIWRELKEEFRIWDLPVRAAKRAYRGPAKQVLVEVSSAASLMAFPLGGVPTVHPLGIELAGKLTKGNLTKAWPRIMGVVSAEESTELVVHPGADALPSECRYLSWGYRWREECDTLSSGIIRELVKRDEP